MSLSVAAQFVPVEIIAREADRVDRESRFPHESIEAMRAAGLLGAAVPARFGGADASARELSNVIRQAGGACTSTGMVYGMHVIATKTIAAGAGEGGELANALFAIAEGRHLTTLAFSERGTRSHFWAQVSRAERVVDGVRFDADKSWVTAARVAETYVCAVGAPDADDSKVTELYLVDRTAPGVEPLAAFDGLGACGNGSSPVRMRGVEVGDDRRLGEPASGFGLMMTATLPWFVLCCASCCVGLSEQAVRIAADHLGSSRLEHLDDRLSDLAVNRARLGEAEIRLAQARALLERVADQLDAGAPDQVDLLALKAAAAEASIAITDELMRACGGAAYSRHLPLERLFRDARAAAVMAPTTEVLRDLLGRTRVGMPLF